MYKSQTGGMVEWIALDAEIKRVVAAARNALTRRENVKVVFCRMSENYHSL